MLLYTEQIQNRINEFILSNKDSFINASSWGEDVIDRFLQFCIKGKMLRGNCVIASFLFNGGENIDVAIAAATALELIHASLLIHDDIMDNDEKRRGKDSLFFQYEKFLQEKGVENAKELGKSLALCVGDIGFFLAYELLNSINIEPTIHRKIIKKMSHELPLVGLGQMQDIFDNRKLSEETIIQTYIYKTARYTFSLPFALGALLAGKDEQIKQFEIFGEKLGLIFQLKDDELGMFGTEKEIGKKVGSDIREGKKTLYYLYLLNSTNKQEQNQLTRIWGSRTSKNDDLAPIYALLEKYNISHKIKTFINFQVSQLLNLLNDLSIKQEHKDMLQSFISYNITREK